MRHYLLSILLFFSVLASAQQISFQRNYAKGELAYITTFTELKSLDIILVYSTLKPDIGHTGPSELELHLMKVDKNGNELWDKLIKKDTTSLLDNRFTTQNIFEDKDENLFLDITYPYGEKYMLKFDREGNQKWESYLHNSFGDYNINNQLIKQRSKHIALSDGSSISLGASFTSVNPKATLSVIDVQGANPYDLTFYRGYFNDAYYLNYEHIYTLGVEQTDTNESLILSDIKLDGAVNFHIKKAHKRNEKIVSTSFFYSSRKIRIAESISVKDTAFYVNVYDYTNTGTFVSSKSYKLNCAATCLNLSYDEVDWVLSNKCKAEQSETIEKIAANASFSFTYSDSFDQVMALKKLHDGNYLFCFDKGAGINLWKLNANGSFKSGASAEGFFAPNPSKDYTSFIGNRETFNKGAKVTLYDMTGNTLRVFQFIAGEPINLNLIGLREGIYVYNLITEDGITFKGKLVVHLKN